MQAVSLAATEGQTSAHYHASDFYVRKQLGGQLLGGDGLKDPTLHK